MSPTRTLGIGLCALGLAACEAYTSRDNKFVPYTQGTVQQQLRQQHLDNARSGVNPGVQNPVAVERGVGGIVRQDAGGTGNVTAGAPVSVNPGTTGIVRQPGVGAPAR